MAKIEAEMRAKGRGKPTGANSPAPACKVKVRPTEPEVKALARCRGCGHLIPPYSVIGRELCEACTASWFGDEG